MENVDFSWIAKYRKCLHIYLVSLLRYFLRLPLIIIFIDNDFAQKEIKRYFQTGTNSKVRWDLNLCALNFNVYTIGCIIVFHSTKNLILVHHGDYMVFDISIETHNSYRDINVCKQSRLQKISIISIVIMREQIFRLAVCCFECHLLSNHWKHLGPKPDNWHSTHSYGLLTLVT